MAARGLALLQVGLVAAAVDRDALQAAIDLDDLRHGARQELAVVADDDCGRVERLHELFESIEAVEVEVVGRLVEQERVVARQQQRGEASARGLAAGQRRGLEVQVDFESDVGERLVRAFFDVGSAEREPAIERVRVAVICAGFAARHRVGIRVHRGLGCADARAPQQELPHRLALDAFLFLREVAERRGRGRNRDRASVWLAQSGEDLEQRRLAGAVRAHESDDVAGRNHEIEARPELARAKRGREAFAVDGDGHVASTMAVRARTVNRARIACLDERCVEQCDLSRVRRRAPLHDGQADSGRRRLCARPAAWIAPLVQARLVPRGVVRGLRIASHVRGARGPRSRAQVAEVASTVIEEQWRARQCVSASLGCAA